MESNGKSVTKNGKRVDYQTGVRHGRRLGDNNELTGIAHHLGRSGHQWTAFILPARASRHETHPSRLYRAGYDAQPNPAFLAPPDPPVQLFRSTRGFGLWQDGRAGSRRVGTGSERGVGEEQSV